MSALDILLAEGLSLSDSLDIIAYGAGKTYKEVSGKPNIPLPPQFLEETLAKLRQNMPVAYVTGRKEFYSLELSVSRDTLIPRPDTECLVDAVLKDIAKDKHINILDLCTGSGAILLALLANLPNARGVGVDISPAALAVATSNAEKLGLSDRAQFIEKDILQGFDMGGVDLLTANPPYVSEAEYAAAEPSLLYEPRLALVPDGDPLSFYKLILSEMKKSGTITTTYFEIAYNAGLRIVSMAEQLGYRAEIIKDLAHNDRVIRLIAQDK